MFSMTAYLGPCHSPKFTHTRNVPGWDPWVLSVLYVTCWQMAWLSVLFVTCWHMAWLLLKPSNKRDWRGEICPWFQFSYGSHCTFTGLSSHGCCPRAALFPTWWTSWWSSVPQCSVPGVKKKIGRHSPVTPSHVMGEFLLLSHYLFPVPRLLHSWW